MFKSIILYLLISASISNALFSDECQKNEERVVCDYGCEPQCGFVPTVCGMKCRLNSCICKEGFVRNTNNECVHRLECTAETTRCPEDEVFQECGSFCQPSCEDPLAAECPHDRCVPNVCRCRPGFVRNGVVCTEPEECRPFKTQIVEVFTL